MHTQSFFFFFKKEMFYVLENRRGKGTASYLLNASSFVLWAFHEARKTNNLPVLDKRGLAWVISGASEMAQPIRVLVSRPNNQSSFP